jgi:hypothetical protein
LLNGALLNRASLDGASLDGAYRPSDPPAGWTPNKNGYLEKD